MEITSAVNAFADGKRLLLESERRYTQATRFLEAPYEGSGLLFPTEQKEDPEMHGQRYRMKTPTLAIMVHDGQNLPITIPRADMVEVVDGPLDGDRLLDVQWEGQKVMMFTNDIRERGEPILPDER